MPKLGANAGYLTWRHMLDSRGRSEHLFVKVVLTCIRERVSDRDDRIIHRGQVRCEGQHGSVYSLRKLERCEVGICVAREHLIDRYSRRKPGLRDDSESDAGTACGQSGRHVEV